MNAHQVLPRSRLGGGGAAVDAEGPGREEGKPLGAAAAPATRPVALV